MKIMVVDDEKDVQILFTQKFRKELKSGKLKFYFATSAEEALISLQGETLDFPCLILADINMPGMNGLELLKILKENFPHLKVFVVTAYGDDWNYQMAMEYGADEYIEKPVQFNQLREKLFNE